MRRRRYPKGSLVHAAGAMGADLYPIESGHVTIQLVSVQGEQFALRRLLTIICKRLRHNGKFAEDLAFLDVPTRLARALVALVESDAWGWDRDPQESLLLEITQAALAAHVGATRESTNKWLGYYERCGFIRCKRDSITVLRLDQLRARAGAQ